MGGGGPALAMGLQCRVYTLCAGIEDRFANCRSSSSTIRKPMAVWILRIRVKTGVIMVQPSGYAALEVW